MNTRDFYNRISSAYDLIADASESVCRDRALEALKVSTGERVLEIGCGTGHALARFSDAVGPTGDVHGLDISEGMTAVALERVRAQRNVTVTIGDACALCLRDAVFDVAFMSFTLELFDAAAIPLVLANIRNVLRPGGRLGVVAMAKTVQTNAIVEIYLYLHRHFPHFIDCRPIDLIEVLECAGFRTTAGQMMSIWGLPVMSAVGVKPVR